MAEVRRPCFCAAVERSNRMVNSYVLGSRVRQAHEPTGNLYSYLQRGLGKFCALRAFSRAQSAPLRDAWRFATSAATAEEEEAEEDEEEEESGTDTQIET